MKEASLVKFYFARYFFLGFAALQWGIAAIMFLQHGNTLKGQVAAYLLFTLGLLFVTIYTLFASRIRRVAVGKKKIAIVGTYKTHRFDASQIKSVRYVPVFNLYSLKIKGRKAHIYFLPPDESEAIYGLFPADVTLAWRRHK